MKRLISGFVVCSLFAFFCGTLAYGQAAGGFLGTVTDPTGSAVVGASVTVTSQATGASRSAVTDGTGHYIVSLLPVSVYTIRVEFKGFQPVESKDVKLQVDEQHELDFSLLPPP